MPVIIKRLSDGTTFLLPDDYGQKTFVKTLKSTIRKEFPPKFPNGCRLIFCGKVMKSRHHLHHYGVADDDTIEMDDRKNWSSSSSSSSATD
jgi:hypothetical protein